MALLLISLLKTLGIAQVKKDISYSAYAEAYYSYDFLKPQNHLKESFIYNHKKNNELNLNIFLLKANYNTNSTRATIAAMLGNYAQYNMSSEAPWAQFVNEANMGFKISKRKNVWVDIGILPSHIGFEGVIAADCWTLTRSIVAENSPYFETGLRMSYTSTNEKKYFSFLVLNGWQRIQKSDYNQLPSLALQYTYKPSTKITLNYSNFLGSDMPDSIHNVRFYNNGYVIAEVTKKTALTAGFDIGLDKYKKTKPFLWLAPILIIKYKHNTKITTAYRAEYFKDKSQVIINTNKPQGSSLLGLSANIDYSISPQMLWRVEAKTYMAKNYKFYNRSANNTCITTSISIKL